MQSLYTIDQVNQMDESEFIQDFGAVYEHSPWVAMGAYRCRPFRDLNDMLVSFSEVVGESTDASKLALLRAHPELAGKAAQRGLLTADSHKEQTSVGLNNLNEQELGEIQKFNALYADAFGFPFIIAVKKHTKAEIFEQMALRIKSCVDDELATALSQVSHIAQLRMRDLVAGN